MLLAPPTSLTLLSLSEFRLSYFPLLAVSVAHELCLCLLAGVIVCVCLKKGFVPSECACAGGRARKAQA